LSARGGRSLPEERPSGGQPAPAPDGSFRATGPSLGPLGGDLHEQIQRLEEALLESQARLEAKDGACGHAWQRLQSSQNEAISLRAGLREKEAEIARLNARCEAAEKRLERFEAASLSILERAGPGGGGDNFNSSLLPRTSPANAASPLARAPASAARGGGGGDLFRRWGIDMDGTASATAQQELPASRPSGGLESFKSAAQAAAEAEDMEAGIRALSAALGGGHTPGLAPRPTPAFKVDSLVPTGGAGGEPAGPAGASKEELEEAVREAVEQGLKGAFAGELRARDVRIQVLEQKLESGGWHSMVATPASARPPPSAGAFSFGVAATQQPQKEAGALQPVLPPRDLPATPRTAFFASQKVPSNIKSGIEGSLTQMKRATSDFRQAKDTIRTAMEGLSSDILAGRGIG